MQTSWRKVKVKNLIDTDFLSLWIPKTINVIFCQKRLHG